MSRRVALALLLLSWPAWPARAQMALPRSSIPTRTALERVGLEWNWMGFIPVTATERVVLISIAEDMFFAQTDQANFHAYDAETGRHRWSTNLGRASLSAQPASVNSDRVFTTNFHTLYCLDRATGRTVWKVELNVAPSSPTAADEEHVVVGLSNGMLSGYTIRDHSQDKPTPGFSAATNVFNWQTRKPITGRPIPADRVVAFGSEDGRAYVAQISPKLLVFRYLTGAAIRASMGTHGLRTLLIPSTDHNLYAVDLFEGTTRWIYPSGAPIDQEPLVAQDEVFVLNADGDLALLEVESGQPKWTMSIRRAQILAVSPTRIYGRSLDGDLVYVDRAMGKILATPRDTAERAGLNLRDFTLALTNHLNDRLYFATPSGFVICLREQGRSQPTLLRHPSKLPFGHIATEEAETPPATPPAEPGEPDTGAVENP
jgi:outer membrane protein assembly factor BamB